MDYNHSFDSREHDSGYFTPSPDKDNTNKLVSYVFLDYVYIYK
jgi:hypothetical protein